MALDGISLWGFLFATIAVVLASLDVGVRIGRRHIRRGGAKLESSGAIVGATMGLLAFMLAFTFNGAAGRHTERKHLVIDEANAIETTWLRAGFLPEPARTEVRGLLRDYVGLRVRAAVGTLERGEAIRGSEALHDQLWARATTAGRESPTSLPTSLFVQSLNQTIDVHLKRLTVGVRDRVPTPVWFALGLLMIGAMAMMGAQIGQGSTRHFSIEVALAVSFSVILFLIADLDRPNQGLIRVSQVAMQELETKLNGR